MRIVEEGERVAGDLVDPCFECGEPMQVRIEFERKFHYATKLCTSCLRVLMFHVERFEPTLECNRERRPGDGA